MAYTVIINNKSVTLPKRTLAIDEMMEQLQEHAAKYAKGEITRREIVEQQFNFVNTVAANTFENMEDVDTNDLLEASTAIIKAYNERAIKAQAEAILQQIRPLANSAEVNKIVGLSKLK